MNDLQLAHFAKRSYNEANIQLSWDIECLVEGSVIAPRGTEGDLRDILRDVRAYPWYNTKIGSFCHRGFLKAATKLYPHVMHIENPTITGHSLGGAIGTLLAAMFVKDNNQPTRLVTFGAPRAGFSTLTRVLQPVDQMRYVNGDDIVPNVPWLMGLYQHTSIEQPIGNNDNNIESHFMDNYIKNLT